MSLYAIYLPPDADTRGADPLEGAVVIKDGFSWVAFFVPLLWLLFRRVWRWALIILAVDIALAVIGSRTGLSPTLLSSIGLLVMLFVGLEARAWRGAALERRGFRLASIVEAASLESAERRFLETGPIVMTPTHPATYQDTPPPPRSRGVIGLFPTQRSF
jgi:hypothetical protein